MALALRVLRASSSSLTRHSKRPLSTFSPPPYRRTSFDDTTPLADADTDTDTDASADPNENGPPTSVVYPRANKSNDNYNPIRLELSRHAEVLRYHIHVACTPNNTHIVMSDERGHPIKSGSWTGGSCGFKGVNRSGYEAGYQCAVRAFARVKQLAREVPGARFEVLFKGFGQGRDAVFKALMTSEGDDVRPYVLRVTDNTPIKIGGTRARKTRRL